MKHRISNSNLSYTTAILVALLYCIAIPCCDAQVRLATLAIAENTPNEKYEATSSLSRLKGYKADAVMKSTSSVSVKKFDPQELPMFCKMEHQMWSSSKMNVRIRLGSLEYVDKLEGKY